MSRRDEKGVALLTVLLLVAVMAAVAVGVLDDLRFGVRRAANVRTIGQAQWYALGAEELARVRIVRQARLDPNRTTLAGGWNGRPFAFPIEQGQIVGRVSDASGCFNLNSVVEERGMRLVRRELGARQFVALLRALGLNEGQASQLTAALVDWIDSDDVALAAEDGAYRGLPTPYRTAGALLAETSELRAVRGYSAEIYERLRPYVCALPTSELSPVNVNTLAADRAVLITAITEGRAPVEAARSALAGRPQGGWPDVQHFWNEPSLVAHTPSGAARDQITMQTRFYALDAEVLFGGSQVLLSSLFEASGGAVRLAARRWTQEE